jgi:hypothetical protein
MKLILCIFEHISGLKINFHKSKIFCLAKAKEEENNTSKFLDLRLVLFFFLQEERDDITTAILQIGPERNRNYRKAHTGPRPRRRRPRAETGGPLP